MYFIKYQSLKEKLRERALTDREALPYFIIFLTLMALASSFSTSDEMNKWDYISGVVSLIISIGGVLYAYFQNGGPDGYDFIQKYVVLGWVITIRSILFFIPVIIILFIIGYFLDIFKRSTSLFDVVVIAVIEIVIYERIGRHIKDTNSR
ncbi:MAG: hypothetical protein WA081_09425 [Desulfosalsimonadaceae bacterium]